MEKFVEVRVLRDTELTDSISSLSQILLDCVWGGASLGFMDNLDHESASKYWQKSCTAI